MPRFSDEMIAASWQLLARDAGQRGRLPIARIRRSISTTYYALFHFLLDECTRRIVGTGNSLARRRRLVARVVSHKVMKTTLDKVRGSRPDRSLDDYLVGLNGPVVDTPEFLRAMAATFSQAQDARLEADYDLNASLLALDAHLLIERMENAIAGWNSATSPIDRDVKHAVCLLILLGGKLRPEVN